LGQEGRLPLLETLQTLFHFQHSVAALVPLEDLLHLMYTVHPLAVAAGRGQLRSIPEGIMFCIKNFPQAQQLLLLLLFTLR
jgi:hypothetical protein